MTSEQNESMAADLWGQIMRDYHHGWPALYAIRRDDGYVADGHSPEVYFSEPDEFFPWEADLLRDLEGPVLDIGAGPGRMASWAEARGEVAVAIESSPLTAAIARERGIEDVRLGPWENLETMLRADERAFGCALLMGHNLGLGGTLAGLERLFRMLHSCTRPGAALLATSIEFSQTDDEVHLTYQKKACAAGRYPGELSIRVEYQGEVGPYFPWLIIAREDLAHIGEQTGWSLERTVSSEEGGHYGAVLRRGPEV